MNFDQKIRALNHKRIDFFRALKLKLALILFSPFSRFNECNSDYYTLVLRMDDKLGDSITATGFLKSLKPRKVIVVAGPTTALIYKKLNFIDQVFVAEKGFFSTLNLFFKLKHYKYNEIINTSHILNPRVLFLVSWLSSQKKISFGNHVNKLFSDHIDIDFKTEHVTERYKKVLNLLRDSGSGLGVVNLDYHIEFDPEVLKQAQYTIDLLRKKSRNIIVLNSFAGARLRNFNQKTTMDIVQKLLKNPDVLVLSIANEGDHQILDSWMMDAGGSLGECFNGRWVHFSNLSSIEINMALVHSSDLIITPDTAWVHIAPALRKKIVAVYREDSKLNEEVNSVIWAPYKTHAQIIFAPSTALNPQDINNVDTNAVVLKTFEMLGLGVLE